MHPDDAQSFATWPASPASTCLPPPACSVTTRRATGPRPWNGSCGRPPNWAIDPTASPAHFACNANGHWRCWFRTWTTSVSLASSVASRRPVSNGADRLRPTRLTAGGCLRRARRGTQRRADGRAPGLTRTPADRPCLRILAHRQRAARPTRVRRRDGRAEVVRACAAVRRRRLHLRRWPTRRRCRS